MGADDRERLRRIEAALFKEIKSEIRIKVSRRGKIPYVRNNRF